MGEIEVLKPGLFTSVQDNGRFGFREFGVPVSGSMDRQSHHLANLLLGNKEDDAVMEITQTGPELLFKNSAHICITGANLSPTLNGEKIKMNKIVAVEENDTIFFGKPIKGYRAYLAVSGGFHTEIVMNSRSWYEGITSVYRLFKSQVLYFPLKETTYSPVHSNLRIDLDLLESEIIEVYAGPEFENLTEVHKELLFSQLFTLGKNANRMAIQLVETIKNNLDSILTGPVIPGTVQLTAGGRLIVLMRDGQTTGGYPRVLQLTERSINKIAQKAIGQNFRFYLRKFE